MSRTEGVFLRPGILADRTPLPTEALCTAPYRLSLVQRLCFHCSVLLTCQALVGFDFQK